jgi:hypothetical protein
LVFVDVYTDWCGPCKTMDAEVFPLPQVGNIYNQSFINYKIDAEKGEGPAIKKAYVVASYPNYLFIDGEGTLIYRAGGSMPTGEFIQHAKNALLETSQGQTIVQMEALYPTHKNDKEFMYGYLSRLTALRLPTVPLLDNYISLLSDNEQVDDKNLKLIADNGTFLNQKLQLGIAFNALQMHAAVYEELKKQGLIKGESIASIKSGAMQNSLRKAIETKNVQLFEQIMALEKDPTVDPFKNKLTLAMEYYHGTKNFVEYKSIAHKYVDGILLQIPTDTLDNWDKKVFDEEKAYLEKQNNPKYNNPIYLSTYKHTQTIMLTNKLSQVSDEMIGLPLSKTEMQMIKGWAAKAVQIAATDMDYYKNVYPFYQRTYAKVLYITGEKEAAIQQMQAILAGLPKSPQIQEHFGNLLAKMIAGEEI